MSIPTLVSNGTLDLLPHGRHRVDIADVEMRLFWTVSTRPRRPDQRSGRSSATRLNCFGVSFECMLLGSAEVS